MISYRLCRAGFAALDGEGARLFGGRWNSPGRAMIYTAGSPSLAVLEILVHLDLPLDLMPDDYRLLTIETPNDAAVDRRDAPLRAGDGVAAGDAFLASGAALALSVPSAVVPQERNLLINPRHGAMAKVRLLADDAFRIDPRLIGG